MSEQEFIYQIPPALAVELNGDDFIDIPRGREGLASFAVVKARQSVEENFPITAETVQTPEKLSERSLIAVIGDRLSQARKYKLDSQLGQSAEDQRDLAA